MTVQFDERARFSLDDKKKILKKSNNRCAHCGKKLTENDVTMDHYIPYSKGGTNDLINIVALCEECNYEKDNNMVYAAHFYRYLNAENIAELDELHDKFSETTKWYSTRNFMKNDSAVVRYSSINRCFGSHRKKNNIAAGIPIHVILSKASYSDLDVIYNKMFRYHEKFGVPTDNLKELLSGQFMKGAVYKIEKGGDLVGILPIGIATHLKKGGIKCYEYEFNGVPCFYQKPENIDMMNRCIHFILQDLASIHPDSAVLFTATCPAKDEFGIKLLSSLSYGEYTEENGWYMSRYLCIFETDEEEKKRKEEGEKSRSYFDKIKEGYSDFLQNTYKLKPLYPKQGKSNSKNIHKKPQRKKDFDEYDIEYYNLG